MLLARAKISEQRLQQRRADIDHRQVVREAANISPPSGKHRAGYFDLP